MNALFGHGLFFVIVSIFFVGAFTVAKIYAPFKQNVSDAEARELEAWVRVEPCHSINLYNLRLLNSSFIFLPSDLSEGSPGLLTHLPVSPGLDPYPLSFVVGDPWARVLAEPETWSPPSTGNILSSTILRQPLSTFGKSDNLHFSDHDNTYPVIKVYVHGRKSPVISSSFLFANLKLVTEDELWRKAEFAFTIFNGSLAGPPVSAKSSGSETVDELLLSEILELAPSWGLPDGYYLASVAP